MNINRRLRKNSVPVVVLTGFLGAGKTTILNHILKHSVGSKIAVIVNDFGEVNIDTLLISGRTETKMELSNGCICCQVGDGELTETFETIVTGVNRPDAIIIEASGLAEPEDIAKLVLMSPNKSIAYGGLLYAVDATQYRDTVSRHPNINDHIKSADMVVLTKTEHLSDGEVSKLRHTVQNITDEPIINAPNGALAPEILVDLPNPSDTQLSLLQQHDHHDHSHLHNEYQSVSFETKEPIAPDRFRKLMNSLPSGVYRAKGIVYFGINGYEQKYIMQAVGHRWDMYAEEWCDDEAPRTALVFIGRDIDEKMIQKAMAATVGESDEMLDIFRYKRAS